MYIFHTAELDSLAAAATLRHLYPAKMDKFTFIQVNHADLIFSHLAEIGMGAFVFFLGFCPTYDELKTAYGITKTITLLDNTAYAADLIASHDDINMLAKWSSEPEKKKLNLHGEVDTECSVAELVYRLCRQINWRAVNRRCKDVPYYIRLLTDLHNAAFRYAEESRFFRLGITIHSTAPTSAIWRHLFDPVFTDRVVKDGAAINRYHVEITRQAMFQYSYDVEYKGWRLTVINSMLLDPMWVHDMALDSYDGVLSYVYDGGRVHARVVAVSDEMDVLAAFTQFSPRGTRFSAEFSCEMDDLPFTKIERRGNIIAWSRYVPVKEPIHLIVNHNNDSTVTVAIPEIGLERTERSAGTARLGLEMELREIWLGVKEGRCVAEINSEWTMDDAAQVLRFVDKHLRTRLKERKEARAIDVKK